MFLLISPWPAGQIATFALVLSRCCFRLASPPSHVSAVSNYQESREKLPGPWPAMSPSAKGVRPIFHGQSRTRSMNCWTVPIALLLRNLLNDYAGKLISSQPSQQVPRWPLAHRRDSITILTLAQPFSSQHFVHLIGMGKGLSPGGRGRAHRWRGRWLAPLLSSSQHSSSIIIVLCPLSLLHSLTHLPYVHRDERVGQSS